jgi:hypothetical protein
VVKLLLKYLSGEEILKGDRVILKGNPGEIEFVAADPDEAESAWYFQEFGGGVMVLEPVRYGRLFLEAEELLEGCDDLEFVSRA